MDHRIVEEKHKEWPDDMNRDREHNESTKSSGWRGEGISESKFSASQKMTDFFFLNRLYYFITHPM